MISIGRVLVLVGFLPTVYQDALNLVKVGLESVEETSGLQVF